tara:strand:+ start:14433 stop:15371 length:939 start_codon:yes stop_codon:yes gene_type:complete
MNEFPKISFVIPFCTIEKEEQLLLDEKEHNHFIQTDSYSIADSTNRVLLNIEKNCKQDYEIIVVDNSNTFNKFLKQDDYKYLRVIKGLQNLYESNVLRSGLIQSHQDGRMVQKMMGNMTMWTSLAFHQGIQSADGEYIVLQHNDLYYHNDFFDMLIEDLNKYAYISVDNKKVWLSTYLKYPELQDYERELKYDFHGRPPKISPEDGGYVKTEFGFSDAYFFMCKKSFFDDYDVDWKYGDSNHGATLKCLELNLPYKHLGPYYDNPNFKTPKGLHTYQYGSIDFCTHLKGGISENKLSNELYRREVDEWLSKL